MPERLPHLPEIISVETVARARLASLGLTLEELANKERVLDIGAKGCEIERAAVFHSINSVVSVDKKFPSSVLASGMRVVRGDAKSLDLPENSADMILVRSSAYYYTKTERETLEILERLNRILKEGGEQRVHPARFGHILEALMAENPDFRNARAKQPNKRSAKDLNIIKFNDNLANLRTVDFLKQRGIFVKKQEGLEPNAEANFKEYLSIPKF